MSSWGNIDDSCLLWDLNQRKQQISQVKVAKVIDCHHHFDSHFIQDPVVHDHSRIVDQDIDMIKIRPCKLCKLFYRFLSCEIKSITFYASLWLRAVLYDIVDGLLILLLVSASKDDIVIVLKQGFSSFISNSCVGPCYHNIFDDRHWTVDIFTN